MDEHGFLAGAITWLYGDARIARCEGCGYSFTTTPAEALAIMEAAPERYGAVLEGRDGMVPVEGEWNATSFVWHLADITRGWAERWVALRATPGTSFAGWDPIALAAARGYAGMPTVSGLWALGVAVDLFATQTRSIGFDAVFAHDWGPGTAGEVTVWLAHEAQHHELDIDERAGRPD